MRPWLYCLIKNSFDSFISRRAFLTGKATFVRILSSAFLSSSLIATTNFHRESHIVSNIAAVRDFLLNNNNFLVDIVYVK